MLRVLKWTRARLRLPRRLTLVLVAIGLAAGGVLAVATTALAASTLCSGFTNCEASPFTDHGWGSNYTNSYWSQDAGDNCTNYVAYYEQTINGMSSSRPTWLASGHNADDWASEASAASITVSHTPAVGAIAQWGDYGWNDYDGHVGIVEAVSNGGATVEVSWDSYSAGPYKWVTLNSTDANTSSAVGWPNNFIYAGSMSGSSGGGSLADGTFFQDSGYSTVYEVVGGAAIGVPSWASVGGVHSVTTISPTVYPSIPRDGTFIQPYGQSTVYEIVGGAALAVPSWASVGGTHTPIVTPSGTYFPSVPASGTFVEDYGSTTVNEIVGGAQLYVPSWDSVGGTQTPVVIPSGTSFPTTPADGTFIRDYGYGTVYEIAGGAAFGLPNWASVGGTPQPVTVIPATVFPTYPTDGTYIEEYGGSTVYEVAGGAALALNSWSDVGGSHPVAQVPSGAVSSQMLTFPVNGFFIKGYTSGEIFQSDGSSITRITSTPPPLAQVVGDWAIINQLGGTE